MRVNKQKLAQILTHHAVASPDKPEYEVGDITQEMLDFFNKEYTEFKEKYPDYEPITDVDEYQGEKDDRFIEILIKTADKGGYQLVPEASVKDGKIVKEGKPKFKKTKFDKDFQGIRTREEAKKKFRTMKRNLSEKDLRQLQSAYQKALAKLPPDKRAEMGKSVTESLEEDGVDATVNKVYKHLFDNNKKLLSRYENLISPLIDPRESNKEIVIKEKYKEQAKIITKRFVRERLGDEIVIGEMVYTRKDVKSEIDSWDLQKVKEIASKVLDVDANAAGEFKLRKDLKDYFTSSRVTDDQVFKYLYPDSKLNEERVPSAEDIEQSFDSEILQEYPVDEPDTGVVNAGDAIAYLYNGRIYEVITYNMRAQEHEHEDGEKKVGDITFVFAEGYIEDKNWDMLKRLDLTDKEIKDLEDYYNIDLRNKLRESKINEEGFDSNDIEQGKVNFRDYVGNTVVATTDSHQVKMMDGTLFQPPRGFKGQIEDVAAIEGEERVIINSDKGKFSLSKYDFAKPEPYWIIEGVMEANEEQAQEAMGWTDNIAYNYVSGEDTQLLSQLYDMAKELGIPTGEIDLRWQEWNPPELGTIGEDELAEELFQVFVDPFYDSGQINEQRWKVSDADGLRPEDVFMWLSEEYGREAMTEIANHPDVYGGKNYDPENLGQQLAQDELLTDFIENFDSYEQYAFGTVYPPTDPIGNAEQESGLEYIGPKFEEDINEADTAAEFITALQRRAEAILPGEMAVYDIDVYDIAEQLGLDAFRAEEILKEYGDYATYGEDRILVLTQSNFRDFVAELLNISPSGVPKPSEEITENENKYFGEFQSSVGFKVTDIPSGKEVHIPDATPFQIKKTDEFGGQPGDLVEVWVEGDLWASITYASTMKIIQDKMALPLSEQQEGDIVLPESEPNKKRLSVLNKWVSELATNGGDNALAELEGHDRDRFYLAQDFYRHLTEAGKMLGELEREFAEADFSEVKKVIDLYKRFWKESAEDTPNPEVLSDDKIFNMFDLDKVKQQLHQIENYSDLQIDRLTFIQEQDDTSEQFVKYHAKGKKKDGTETTAKDVGIPLPESNEQAGEVLNHQNLVDYIQKEFYGGDMPEEQLDQLDRLADIVISNYGDLPSATIEISDWEVLNELIRDTAQDMGGFPQISEQRTGQAEIRLPDSNIILHGAKNDANGNWTVQLEILGMGQNFSIQTLHLEYTHKTTRRHKEDLTQIPQEDLQKIRDEIVDYIANHGSDKQKANLKADANEQGAAGSATGGAGAGGAASGTRTPSGKAGKGINRALQTPAKRALLVDKIADKESLGDIFQEIASEYAEIGDELSEFIEDGELQVSDENSKEIAERILDFLASKNIPVSDFIDTSGIEEQIGELTDKEIDEISDMVTGRVESFAGFEDMNQQGSFNAALRDLLRMPNPTKKDFENVAKHAAEEVPVDRLKAMIDYSADDVTGKFLYEKRSKGSIFTGEEAKRLIDLIKKVSGIRESKIGASGYFKVGNKWLVFKNLKKGLATETVSSKNLARKFARGEIDAEDLYNEFLLESQEIPSFSEYKQGKSAVRSKYTD